MGLIPKVLSVVLLVGCLDSAVPMAGEIDCDGPYKGRKLTPEEVATVLHNHQTWQSSGSKANDTRRARLCAARLTGADLRKANLQEAKLSGANLQRSWLNNANLQEAALSYTNLQETKMWGANLQRANLFAADLHGADLSRADLQDAYLYWANFQNAIYEPVPGKLPNFWTLIDPRNHLETMIFYGSVAIFM
jgi:hypothetical protein